MISRVKLIAAWVGVAAISAVAASSLYVANKAIDAAASANAEIAMLKWNIGELNEKIDDQKRQAEISVGMAKDALRRSIFSEGKISNIDRPKDPLESLKDSEKEDRLRDIEHRISLDELKSDCLLHHGKNC